MEELGKRVVFVWVQGHIGLVSHEGAEREAVEASALCQNGVACMYNSIRSLCCWREVVELLQKRFRRVYGEGMHRDLEETWLKDKAVSLARLRSRHSTELVGYKRRIWREGRDCESVVERM